MPRSDIFAPIPNGFCLLELLATLTLAAILAAFALPTTRHLLEYGRLKRETLHLCAAIETLTLAAQQKEKRLVLAFSQHDYHAYTKENPEHLLIKRTLRPPLALELGSNPAEPPLTLQFHPSGVVTPQSLNLTDGRRRCTVIVSLRGRVSCTC